MAALQLADLGDSGEMAGKIKMPKSVNDTNLVKLSGAFLRGDTFGEALSPI